MDYREALLLGVSNTIARSTPWDQESNAALSKAMYIRAMQGPISAQQAVYITGMLMPTSFTFSFPPLAVTTTGAGPASNNLAPLPTQGIKSWYWNLTQFTNGDGKDSGVLLVLQQQSIVPNGEGITVWSLYAGAVDPDTKAWVSPETVYMDNDQVTIVPNGAIFSSPDAVGSIIASSTGFDISVTMIKAGFSFQVSSTSARGPTYEQSGGNVKKLGVFQNGYWSIVDGVITKPPAKVVSLQLTSTGKQYTYNGGYSWLDYQQFGLLQLPPLERLFASVTKSSAIETVWLFLVIQTPDIQIDAYLIDPSALSQFSAGKSGKKWNVGNVWQTGKPAKYDVPCNVQLVATYPGTTIPSAIKVTMDGYGVYVLTSYSKGVPYLQTASGSGYESPSYVTINGAAAPAARGVIEWVPKGVYPTQQDALVGAAMSTDILKARDASSLAIATVTLSSIGLAGLLALGIWALVVLISSIPQKSSKGKSPLDSDFGTP
jgi:hypothetical protein